MDSHTEITQFVRDIRGAAASVLWVLMLTGRSLTGQELEEATGYSDKSVRSGLDRLATYGLIQDNGQLNGHSINGQLPLPFLQLWQGHHGKFIEDGVDDASITDSAQTGRPQAAAYSPDGHKFPLVDAGSQDTLPGAVDGVATVSIPSSEKIGNSDLLPAKIGNSDLPSRDLGCLVGCSSLTPEEEKPINQTTKTTGGEFGNSDLPPLLRRLRITGRAYAESCQRQDNPAQVLAWHWWVRCQPWLNRNPVGYVVARLKEGKPAPGEFLALVEWWQGLDADGRHAALSHVSGSDNGLKRHDPATSGNLAYWLEDEFDDLPDTAVLDALIDLARYAPEELRQ